MSNNFKKYDIFTLLSVFARSMIEVFIPIYLYTRGFTLEDIFLYFLLMLLISAIICVPLCYLGKFIKYKWLIFISSFFFGITYYLLFNIEVNIASLFLLSLSYALYRRSYWIGKRYFELIIIPKRNMANNVSKIVIISQIATIFASYTGAVLLNNLTDIYALIVSVSIYIIGILPLMMIREPKNDEKIIIDSKNALKVIPIKNIISSILYEFIYISSFIFPIYLYLYVQENFEYIGIYNAIVGIASITCVYLFSKKMDKDKHDYILLSALLLATTFLLKLNCTVKIMVLIIGLFEGIFSKIHEVGYTRNIYYFGSHYNITSYNTVFEIIQNYSRLAAFALIFLITRDLKIILFLCIIAILLSAFVKFDDGKGGYK